MICPECGSKTKIIDTRENTKENEVYRLRACKNEECCSVFYTIEFVAEETYSFKRSWKDARRKGNKR